MTEYNNNTIRRAERILGYGIKDTGGTRTFTIIGNTIYTDLYEGDVSLPIDVPFKRAFNGNTNDNDYYNEIILDYPQCGTIDLDFTWGSCQFNTDIDGLLSWLNDNPVDLGAAGVSSTKIEDFSVSYKSATEKALDISVILNDGYGYYVRKPMMIDIARDQKDASRYF